MALYQILYTSNALRQMDMADLGRIEQVSVRNNRAAGVTGLLLYVGGNFLQYLEGSQAAVEGIYGKLHRDRRHYGLTVIHRAPRQNRLFDRWAMGVHAVLPGEAGGDALFRLSHKALERRLSSGGQAAERTANVPVHDPVAPRLIRTFWQVCGGR